jgi:hypothetical protein
MRKGAFGFSSFSRYNGGRKFDAFLGTASDCLNESVGLMKSRKLIKASVAAFLFFVMAVASQVDAGDVTGPNLHKDQVLANHTDSYEITFEGDEKAVVAIIGDGDTDLDLFIYDENDNLIGENTDLTDRCSVEWTPSWTGKFSIKIKNLGSVYNEYVLITN